MPDFSVNFPDLGKITLDLNALEPSIIRALRDALVAHEDEHEGEEISAVIVLLESALIKLNGEA